MRIDEPVEELIEVRVVERVGGQFGRVEFHYLTISHADIPISWARVPCYFARSALGRPARAGTSICET